jgi:hypothetical protein
MNVPFSLLNVPFTLMNVPFRLVTNKHFTYYVQLSRDCQHQGAVCVCCQHKDAVCVLRKGKIQSTYFKYAMLKKLCLSCVSSPWRTATFDMYATLDADAERERGGEWRGGGGD